MHYRIVLKSFSVTNDHQCSVADSLESRKGMGALFSLAAYRMKLILTRSKTWCILDLLLNFIVVIKGRIH